MRLLSHISFACLLLLGLAACSDGGGDSVGNNGNGGVTPTPSPGITPTTTPGATDDPTAPPVTDDPIDDRDGDGVADADDNCPLTPNPDQSSDVCPGEAEGETPWDRNNPGAEREGVNDTLEDAKAVPAEGVIHGFIDIPDIDINDDLDVYRITVTAGQRARITVEGPSLGSSFVPSFVLRDEVEQVARGAVGSDSVDASREVFFPWAGDYFITVEDFRNLDDPFDTGDDSAHVGGLDHFYVLRVELMDPPEAATALPIEIDADAADGSVLLHRVSLSEGDFVRFETIADRVDADSALDTVIYLLDPTLLDDEDGAVLELADDIELEGSLDSLLRWRVDVAGDYLVAVDYYNHAPDVHLNYTFQVEVLDGAGDLEPNDDYETAIPIAAGDTIDGDIGAPQVIDEETFADYDYYRLEVEEGDYISFQVAATEGSELQPRVWVLDVDQDFGEEFVVASNVARPDLDAPARVDVLFPYSGPTWVVVSDVRNDEAEVAEDIVGGNHGYQLTVTARDIEPVFIQPEGSHDSDLLHPGASVWFTTPFQDDKRVRISLEKGPQADPDFDPVLFVYADGEFSPMAETLPTTTGLPGSLTFVNLTAAAYRFRVMDRDYGGGAAETGAAGRFTLRLSALDADIISDSEPNDTRDQAQDADPALGPLGAIEGSVEGPENVDPADYYAMDLSSSRTLTVWTQGGRAEPLDDGVLTLLDPDGRIVASSDDFRGELYGTGYFSGAFIRLPIPDTARYFLRVTPWAPRDAVSELSGTYALVAFTEGCALSPHPQPEEGDIIFNEVYFNLADGDAGDANGDGITNIADQFVELVSASNGPLDVSGVEILVGEETVAAMPCGSVLQGRTSLVVFGGLTPDGTEYGRSLVREVRGGLNLDQGEGIITVQRGAGQPITSFEYSDGIFPVSDTGESLTRSPDVTGEFTLHRTATDDVTSLFSPGVRADGEATPFGNAEEEPNDAEDDANLIPEVPWFTYGTLDAESTPGDDEIDYYRLTLREDDPMVLTFRTLPAPGEDGDVGDTVLTVYDAADEVVGFADDIDLDRENFYSRIDRLEMPGPGEYIIEVSAFEGSFGAYYLSIETPRE